MNAVVPRILELEYANKDRTFIDRHFVEISFIISTLVQFIFGPLTLMLGMAAGITYSTHIHPNLRIRPNEKVIGVSDAVFAIVGAFASIIRVSPAGSAGGFIFQAVPYLASFTVGTSLYRSYKYCC